MMSSLNSFDSEPLTKLTRNQYILRVGVLGWGVPVGILFAIVQSFEFGWDSFIVRLIPSLILFPLGGILFGLFMWKLLHRKEAATLPSHRKE